MLEPSTTGTCTLLFGDRETSAGASKTLSCQLCCLPASVSRRSLWTGDSKLLTARMVLHVHSRIGLEKWLGSPTQRSPVRFHETMRISARLKLGLKLEGLMSKPALWLLCWWPGGWCSSATGSCQQVPLPRGYRAFVLIQRKTWQARSSPLWMLSRCKRSGEFFVLCTNHARTTMKR